MKVSELFEARIKGALYTTKEVKGKIEKVIAELKGQNSSSWTKITKQFVDLDNEIKKLQDSREKLNLEIKDKATDVFDLEDEVLTRVVETAQLTVTLSKKVKKEAHPEVNADAVVDALAKADLPKELRKMVDACIKANTKMVAATETPERLTVKVNKVEESFSMSSLIMHMKEFMSQLQHWILAFDHKYTKVDEMVKMMRVSEID